MTSEQRKAIEEARIWLRRIWLDWHDNRRLDALEHESVYNAMRGIENILFETAEVVPFTMKARCTACGDLLSPDEVALRDEGYLYCQPCATAIRRDAERQHAREVEDVCTGCGGRTINGKCSLCRDRLYG